MLLLLTALWLYYLASSQLFSGKFSAGKDSQVHATELIFPTPVLANKMELFGT